MKTFLSLLYPVTTEKTQRESKAGKYTFLVRRDTTKIDVKNIIASIYKVDVKSVNMLWIKAKNKYGAKQRVIEKRSPLKKAVVTLKSGQSLEVNKFKEKK